MPELLLWKPSHLILKADFSPVQFLWCQEEAAEQIVAAEEVEEAQGGLELDL